MSKIQDWRSKFEEASALLQEKEKILTEYRKAIQQSHKMMKEVMDKLAFELKIAHQIHRILLPVELPVIAGCEFSFKFRPADKDGKSKDFYEILPHPASKSFSIIMSSCSSHALSALMFSARLKMLSRGERVDRLEPHEFVAQLIEEINIDTSNLSETRGGYPLWEKTALFYAHINQRTYQMSYCLIGNIFALVQYAETGDMEQMKISAMSLEEEQVDPLKTYTVSLNGRDRLVICSPGILCCKSPEGSPYSLSALKESLRSESSSTVHEVRNRILYNLKSFAKGEPSKRDQSVMVMDVKSRILKLTKNE